MEVFRGYKMNTNTPSKELLEQLFGVKIGNISEANNNIRIYKSDSQRPWMYNASCGMELNIYELTIKTKQKYPSLDLNLAATDISEFWRQANELVVSGSDEKQKIKYGDYCWVWDKSVHNIYPQIAMFERMVGDKFDTDIGDFDFCELFNGKLPSIIIE
jgi:hypothetical protein